ncbi:MAG TPA: hypothetical protein VFO31_01295 [Vicinamibacterales bacterium]|nr:hypothetical protein [Vicinamibacterales bacterium]
MIPARLVRACVALAVLLAPAAAAAQMNHDQQPPPGEQPQYPSLKLSGFADINFSETRTREGPQGFSLGQFTLHLASALSPRVTFFGELSFTARTDAGTDSPPVTGFNAEVERLILRFDQSDRFKISFGRYHTPINWWNTAYHHGSWLQTTISRPEMIQFGGRLLPVHFIGGLVEGAVPAGGLNLNYKGGIGNGRGSVISRGGDAGDNNGSRAYLANGFVKPDRIFGLEAGAAVYGDTLTIATDREFGERIFSGYVVWHKETPEILAEVASVRHVEAGTSLVTWSHAYYIQAAYRLPIWRDVLKPYYRFEHIGVDEADAVFSGLPNLDGSTVGLRYDVAPFAAVKAEFRTWRRAAEIPRNHGGFFQVCFTF